MDITQSYQMFSKAVQRFVTENPGSTSLERANPSQLGSKAYRDTLVSRNILRKSLQLYNDITSTQAQTKSKLTDATEYLEDIKQSSLQDVLQSYVKTNIRDIIQKARGSGIDQNN